MTEWDRGAVVIICCEAERVFGGTASAAWETRALSEGGVIGRRGHAKAEPSGRRDGLTASGPLLDQERLPEAHAERGGARLEEVGGIGGHAQLDDGLKKRRRRLPCTTADQGCSLRLSLVAVI
jgi:hypothetical protein